MVTLINPCSKLHYLRALRSPALLGCDSCKYGMRGRAALQGLRGSFYSKGRLSYLGDGEDEVTPGTFLIYTVTLAPTSLRITSANGIVTKISPVLFSKWGLNVERSSTSDLTWFLQGDNITLVLRSTRTYHAADDVRAIVNGEIYNTAGFQVQSSTIQKIDVPAGQNSIDVSLTPVAPDGGGGSGSTDWTTIAVAVGIGAIGLYAVKELL